MTAPRISPSETRKRLRAQPPALLVCAYDDEAKCASMKIEGSLNLREFADRLAALRKDQEIIFYCG